jgi:hypothetical protein
MENEGLHNLYSSPNYLVINSRRMGWAVHLARVGEIRSAYNFLSETQKGRDRPVGRPRHRREDNIGMKYRVGRCNWIHLAEDRDQ